MSPAKGNIALNWESLFKTVRKKKKKITPLNMACMSLLIRWLLPIREQKIELGPHLLQGLLTF